MVLPSPVKVAHDIHTKIFADMKKSLSGFGSFTTVVRSTALLVTLTRMGGRLLGYLRCIG